MSSSPGGAATDGTGVPDKIESNGPNNNRRNRGHRKSNNANTTSTTREVKFDGREPDLSGHIYDCTYKQADMYSKTTREIAEYVGRTYKYGTDVRLAIESLKNTNIEQPEDPPDPATRTQTLIWEKRVVEYVKRETAFEDNMKTLYSLIWGQCTDALRAKLQARSNHKTIATSGDSIELLKNIKDTAFNIQSERYNQHTIFEAKRRLDNLYQDRNMTCEVYLERFMNQVSVIEHCGASVIDMEMIETSLKEVGLTFTTASAEELSDAKAYAKDKYLACMFLVNADRNRYGKLIEDTQNLFIQGDNKYPETLTEAYALLIHWRQDPKNFTRMMGLGSEGGVSFATHGEQTPKKDLSHVTCFNCQEKGHFSSNCPKGEKKEGQTHIQTGTSTENNIQHTLLNHDVSFTDAHDNLTTSFQFLTIEDVHQKEENGQCYLQDKTIPMTWIILDNGSTVDVFTNPKLLKNIRTTSTTMTIKCNAGSTTTNQIGELDGYGTVWYNPHGIANILSLSKVQEKHRVTYDSEQEAQFVVYKPDGTKRIFTKSSSGLFYLDTKKTHHHNETTCFINTVEDIRSKFTNREYDAALLARKVQNLIGRPSMRAYIDIVRRKLLKNCPVNPCDITNAEKLFGPNVGSLKGKTVHRHGEIVQAKNDHIPRELFEDNRDITLCIDMMFINKMVFLVTISRHIKFGTVEVMANRKAKTILKSVLNVHRLYKKRGFRIKIGLMDNEFEPLRSDFADIGIELNIAARDEHVPEIERYIRTVKERTRCVYNTLPYKLVPNMMLVEMVQMSIFWLNSFPAHDSVSGDLSPRQVMIGSDVDYSLHCKIEFGAYAQVHEEHNNTMITRTTGAIALRPTGNFQGGHYFMSLDSGRRLNRNHWTELPVPKEVIDRVHALARISHANRGLIFADRHGNIMPEANFEDVMNENNDDQDNHDDPELGHDNEDCDIPPEHVENNIQHYEPQIPLTGVNIIDHDDERVIQQLYENENAQNNYEEPIADEPEIHYEEVEADDRFILEDAVIDDNVDQNEDIEEDVEYVQDDANDEDTQNMEDDMDTKYGERGGQYNLRPRKPRDYGHLHTTLEYTCMTQYSINKGIKEFKEAGTAAVIKEMQQLNERKVIEPKMAHMLTREEKSRALHYLMFLKRKRCGMIKARGCADGRKQRIYKSKQETSAPTVAVESLMLSCTIDAYENRHVATADVPGAFMQADIDEVLHMKLEGTLALLLIETDKDKYEKYLTHEHGKPIIYVQLTKALYGTLQAALLFWRDLSSKLTELGFELNPYDSCVANKVVNGQQCTVLWHVDDIKISHADMDVVETVLAQLNAQYGKEAPLVVTRGTVHEYLGMTLDYGITGKCRICMTDYVNEILDELPESMSGTAVTPAANHLFEVNEEAVKLSEADAQFFHHNTAKLLFLSKRARPDIQTAVAFLTTRVKNPDVDDIKKLGRVMAYLRNTPDLVLALEAHDMTVIKWWVDGSYAVHPDMRSHTGGTMSLGKGSVYSTSIRQKLTTKSSTEAELVGVADVMPQILWTRYFLEAQGYNTKASMLYQDNMSAILLEKNGRASSGKRTRHLNIRYFFVTDRVKTKEIAIDHCPTGEMRGDFFTKPLQGALFRKFRSEILNME